MFGSQRVLATEPPLSATASDNDAAQDPSSSYNAVLWPRFANKAIVRNQCPPHKHGVMITLVLRTTVELHINISILKVATGCAYRSKWLTRTVMTT